MKILTGMSGGVDSSVTAAMPKEAGHEVIGATMAIWGDKGVHKKLKEQAEKAGRKPTHGACCGPDEKEDIETKCVNNSTYRFTCSTVPNGTKKSSLKTSKTNILREELRIRAYCATN